MEKMFIRVMLRIFPFTSFQQDICVLFRRFILRPFVRSNRFRSQKCQAAVVRHWRKRREGCSRELLSICSFQWVCVNVRHGSENRRRRWHIFLTLSVCRSRNCGDDGWMICVYSTERTKSKDWVLKVCCDWNHRSVSFTTNTWYTFNFNKLPVYFLDSIWRARYP